MHAAFHREKEKSQAFSLAFFMSAWLAANSATGFEA
jgi:hypothetical protein